MKITKKIYERSETEKEKLLKLIIEHCNLNVKEDFHISVIGSFANSSMKINNKSDIDVIVRYGIDDKIGHVTCFKYKGRKVNVSLKPFEYYPENRFRGEKTSHYSLTEDKLYKGEDDEKRAYKKGRLVKNYVHCDYCGDKINVNEIITLQIVSSVDGIVRERFICEKCYGKNKYDCIYNNM